jgi:hypothetical protein
MRRRDFIAVVGGAALRVRWRRALALRLNKWH